MIILTILPLTGCWDRRELEDLGFVLVLGLDQGPSGTLLVTFAVAKPALLGGGGEKGGGGGNKPYLILPVVAPSVSTAMNVANSAAARRLTLIHTNAVVIGQSLAESGLDPYLSEVVRFREMRETAGLFVCRGTARDLLDAWEPGLEMNPAKATQGAMATYQYTGFVPRAMIFPSIVEYVAPSQDMVAVLVALREKGSGEALSSPQGGSYREGDYIAGDVPRPVGENNLEAHGLAVFSGGRMVGTLTGDEATIYNMIKGTFASGFFSIPDPTDPSKKISIDLRRARPPKIHVQWPEPDTPRIHIQLDVEGDIIGIQSLVDYADPRKTGELERAVSDLLENDAEETVKKLQGYGADSMGLGRYARPHFATFDQWQAFHWPDKFPDVEIKVDVKASVRRIGVTEGPLQPQ